MNFRPIKKGSDFTLDITPLVDTVFNLMIFFALSLNFLAVSGLKIKLPQAGFREMISPEKTVDISITADEKIYLNKKEVNFAEVEKLLEDMYKAGFNKLIIKADERVRHGLVVRILDIAKRTGFQSLAIAASPMEEK